MSDLENKFNEIRSFFSERANPEIVKKYSKYFREGYDAWGIDQKTFEDQRDKWLNAWRDQLSIDDFLQLGDLLVSTGKYEESSCAILFVEAHKEKLHSAGRCLNILNMICTVDTLGYSIAFKASSTFSTLTYRYFMRKGSFSLSAKQNN
ncbi:hypothetical protein ES708_10928 [subsurface metagenome]